MVFGFQEAGTFIEECADAFLYVGQMDGEVGRDLNSARACSKKRHRALKTARKRQCFYWVSSEGKSSQKHARSVQDEMLPLVALTSN